MKLFIKVMKALSDPTRVKIVKMLQHKTMCVCEIQEALGIAQSTASKHLKTLEEADLVTYRKDGLWVNYMLSNTTENQYAAKLMDELEQWLEDDNAITCLIDRLPEIRRDIICKR